MELKEKNEKVIMWIEVSNHHVTSTDLRIFRRDPSLDINFCCQKTKPCFLLMASIHRILVKTHHMTSRKKILVITKAAKRLSCSVLLKTGGPPGIMIAEGEGGLEWLDIVKKLRYKDYQLMKKEPVLERRLDVSPGSVLELTSMKELGAFLERNDELYEWWRVGMGYKKGDDMP